MSTAAGLDSFDDDTPIELPVEGETSASDSGGQPSGIDSFDDDTPIELSDKQVDQLEDDEGVKDEPKKEDTEKKVEDEKKDDKEPEKDSQEAVKKSEEESKQSIPRGKSIRVKDSEGNPTDLALDSTVKMKVNGKNEIVTVQELRDNYSGKVRYDEKFSDLQSEKETVEKSRDAFQSERNEIVSHLSEISKILDDPDKSPFEALNYLVDMSGRNILDFNKKVMSHMAEEVRNLDGMDDVERDLYWKNKELDAVRSNQAAKDEKATLAKTQRESQEKIDRLRESQGVTEEQFVESHRELKELGYKDDQITSEAIVNYSVMKPHFEKAESMTAEYEEELSDDQTNELISTVANTLKNYPRVSEQKALEISLDLLGWDYEREEDFKELNKLAGEQPVEKKSFGSYQYGQKTEKVESFDDYEDY